MTQYKQRSKVLSEDDFKALAALIDSGALSANGNPITLSKAFKCEVLEPYIYSDTETELVLKGRKNKVLQIIRSVGVVDSKGNTVPAFAFNARKKAYEANQVRGYTEKILTRHLNNALNYSKDYPEIQELIKRALLELL